MLKLSRRTLGFFLGGIVVVVLAVFWIISAKVNAFLRGEEFRRLISAKTGDVFHSEAEYSPLRWTGASVFSDSFQAIGKPGSPVGSIQADQIRAAVNWRAVFGGAWRVDRIDILNLQGTFRAAGPKTSGEAASRPPQIPIFAALLPRRFELGELVIAKARFDYGDSEGKPLVSLKDTAVKTRPSGVGWTIDGSGGTLFLPSVPPLSVTNFRTRMQTGVFFLTDAALRVGETGKITASGEFASQSRLHVQWERIDLKPFLNAEWKDRLSGSLAGEADATSEGGSLADASVTGTFRVTEGLMQHVSLLDEVAKFTSAPQFRRMPIQEFSGKFRWANRSLTLSDLVLESKGLLRVEGTCAISDTGAVDGQLRVGVTPQTLQWLPGSRERVFTVARNGYVWTDLRVGGTVHHPTEDLSSRLAGAMKDEMIRQGVRAIEQLPNATKGGVQGVLDILTPLIR